MGQGREGGLLAFLFLGGCGHVRMCADKTGYLPYFQKNETISTDMY